MPSVVLVTGVGRYLGSRLAAQLAADEAIDRVIGVDVAPPPPALRTQLGRTQFVRADIRNPLITKLIRKASVDTVVHAALTAAPRGVGGRASMQELNIIGTMQLLAACQNSPSVRRLVVKSATSVYGSSPRDPAIFTEDMSARRPPRAGYSKDAVDMEGYVRGLGRRRPDLAITVFRFANFLGPTIDSPFARYLSLPVVPTPLGFDPRLQFVHPDDAVEVLRLAVLADRPGIFNVAGSGILLLSQAIRRAGRLRLPIAAPAVSLVSGLVRRSGLIDFSPDQMRFLTFGRVVDGSRLRTEFGYTPQYSTPETLADFVAGRPLAPVLPPQRLRWAELVLDHLVGAEPVVS
jgi:UDP-glucose 4-epimerase